MVEEYASIVKNDVWDVVSRPHGKSDVTSKWLFKVKHGTDCSIEKFKVRFISQAFSQKKGEDYEDIFPPVAQYTNIHSMISLASSQGCTLHNMYVKTTFLHGMLQEELYVEKPQDLKQKITNHMFTG